MRRLVAALVTAAVLGVVLVFGWRKPAPRPSAPTATPHRCIERMFDAAERGDVPAYLDCFTGPERQRLERELAGQSREQFARSLTEAVATLKGRAVFESPTSSSTPGQAELVVERVYANRMERQVYRLVAQSNVWRVYEVGATESFQPEKPWGTPVFELPAASDSGR